MRSIGGVPIVGDFDFEISIPEEQRLFDKLEEIHGALKGANVNYTITTLSDSEARAKDKLIAHFVDQKPIEVRRSLYKAKLDRWKSMGLDVSELESLLETDMDRFKEASKDFLRTHLDHMSVVKDRRSEDNVIDGQILALLDEEGKPLPDIISVTGFTEEEVLLSLGRLISAGSAMRSAKEAGEIYSLIPPPAPGRKALSTAPAKDDEEAEARVLQAIGPDGSSEKDIGRSSRLPKEQFAKALDSLAAKGSIKRVGKGRKELITKA